MSLDDSYKASTEHGRHVMAAAAARRALELRRRGYQRRYRSERQLSGAKVRHAYEAVCGPGAPHPSEDGDDTFARFLIAVEWVLQQHDEDILQGIIDGGEDHRLVREVMEDEKKSPA